MAAVAVGGVFLSVTLRVLFDRMASLEVLDFIRGRKVPNNLLVKLETSCLAFNAVLNDAKEKEISDPLVKKWLDDLRDVCDAENLLDEIATKALQCQLEAKNKTDGGVATIGLDERLLPASLVGPMPYEILEGVE
nr:putative disease resistance rpp13-like protein 1 [Quercus suber]